MLLVKNNSRVFIGLIIGLLIIFIGVLILRTLNRISATSLTDLRLMTYILFYAAVISIYLLTIFLWSKFCTFTHQPRSIREYVIDTGLLAIGKYVPGKVLGVAMRGAVQSSTISFNKNSIKISFIEQLCVLAVGILLGASIYANQHWLNNKIILTISALIFCSWLAVFTQINLSQRFFNFPKATTFTTAKFSLKQSLGYLLLWVITSIPLLILIWDHYTLQPIQVAQVSLAFTFAMLSGWIAFFAPGGLGVRESSFVFLAPAFMDWQVAASWIVLHRVLLTIFDILYGLAVSVWVFRTVKKVSI